MGRIVLGPFQVIRGCAGLLALALLCGAPPARSHGDCDSFFPDLTCGRSGRYADFVPPMSAPYVFEDPFITTSLNMVAIGNDFPRKSVFQGGHMRVGTAQIRIAITDRLGVFASKNGQVSVRPKLRLFDTEKGFMNIGAGLKFALIDWPEERFILTPAVRYEATQGSIEAFSGYGEGAWVPSVSMGWGVGHFQVLGSVSARLPLDGDAESTPGFYHLHVDYTVTPRLHPFVELSGVHYFDEGRGTSLVEIGTGARLPIGTLQTLLGTGGFEGGDLFNLGSDAVKGHDIVTAAIGFQLRVREDLFIGVSYERPVTRRKDLIQQRVTLMLMWEL